MRCEHSTGEQVGLAHVVEEAADVAIEAGVDAVQILWLGAKKKKTQKLDKKAERIHGEKSQSKPLIYTSRRSITMKSSEGRFDFF